MKLGERRCPPPREGHGDDRHQRGETLISIMILNLRARQREKRETFFFFSKKRFQVKFSRLPPNS